MRRTVVFVQSQTLKDAYRTTVPKQGHERSFVNFLSHIAHIDSAICLLHVAGL
jgi:hypothetical protein